MLPQTARKHGTRLDNLAGTLGRKELAVSSEDLSKLQAAVSNLPTAARQSPPTTVPPPTAPVPSSVAPKPAQAKPSTMQTLILLGILAVVAYPYFKPYIAKEPETRIEAASYTVIVGEGRLNQTLSNLAAQGWHVKAVVALPPVLSPVDDALLSGSFRQQKLKELSQTVEIIVEREK
jgi:hypothetical protein